MVLLIKSLIITAAFGVLFYGISWLIRRKPGDPILAIGCAAGGILLGLFMKVIFGDDTFANLPLGSTGVGMVLALSIYLVLDNRKFRD